jgi:hypothetical protein
MAKIRRSFEYGQRGETVGTTTTVSFAQELGLLALILAVGLVSCHTFHKPAPAAAAAFTPTDARSCAAAAVFTKATADDWLQRAAIAQASLNAFKAGGTASNPCGLEFGGAVPAGALQTIRWRDSLDAADAVASGNYSLPDACRRATVVAPSPASQWPGAQCEVDGLVFVEAMP